MNEQTKSKRGRPVGSNSFQKVRLQDLLAQVDANTVIPVSKVWLRDQNISVEAPTNISIPAAHEEKTQPKIEYALTSFE